MMNDADKLRSARNAYRSSVVSAKGFVAGRRVQSMKLAEDDLRTLLWQHRDALVEAFTQVSQPGTHMVFPLSEMVVLREALACLQEECRDDLRSADLEGNVQEADRHEKRLTHAQSLRKKVFYACDTEAELRKLKKEPVEA